MLKSSSLLPYLTFVVVVAGVAVAGVAVTAVVA
jgi:hypothetical protein